MFKMFDKKHEYDNFFYPKSIAVVGASNKLEKIGGYIFSELIKNSEIEVFPVNVKWKEIQEKKAFTRLSEIKKPVSLAIIAIPAEHVLESIKDAIEANIKNIIIISAGFKEIGDEGELREEELKKLIWEGGLNVIGPNCLGILNSINMINCSFSKDLPQPGNIALISQSGAFIDAIIDWSLDNKIGFSKIASIGNMIDVDEIKLLKYLKEDTQTKAIAIYMESLKNGTDFAEILREISKEKPVVILNPGKSEESKKAILSHTGSLAPNSKLIEALIKENGGILTDSLTGLEDILIAFNSSLTPNKNTAIVTNAGGFGVITADSISKTDLVLCELSEKTIENLSFLPNSASFKNPVDILGDAKSQRYLKTIEILGKDEKVENIFVILTPQMMTDSKQIAEQLCEYKENNSEKCIFSSFVGGKEIDQACKIFKENSFANFKSPERAIYAVDKILNWKKFSYSDEIPTYNFNKEKISRLNEKIENEKGLLSESLSREIIEGVLAIKVPEKQYIDSFEDIIKIKLEENKKYVLKVNSKDIVHKIEVGGVIDGIDKNNFIETAEEMFDKMCEITRDFTLTLEEHYEGTETILGLKNDELLGTFILFGFGGTYVNVIEDSNFSMCPLNHERAKKLVENSKVYDILKGYRGSLPIHFKHLHEIMVRLSFLPKLFPNIKEVDINPLICSSKGVYLADIKIIV